MTRYLDHNSDEGWIETFDYDEGTNTAIIRRSCDVQPIIDRNKELANHTDGWTDREKNMRHVAAIPMGVALKWYEDYGIQAWRKDDWPWVARLLNDSDWRNLRISGGHLGGAHTIIGRASATTVRLSDIRRQLEARLVRGEWFVRNT